MSPRAGLAWAGWMLNAPAAALNPGLGGSWVLLTPSLQSRTPEPSWGQSFGFPSPLLTLGAKLGIRGGFQSPDSARFGWQGAGEQLPPPAGARADKS